MSALARRQRRFIAAVHGEVPAEGALRIYRGNALATWHDALEATFPVVRRLVGPAFFREACDRYAEAHPSVRGDLHAYGERFARFLAAYAPAQALPWLEDMARLEWALHDSAFAADAERFDFTALAGVPVDSHGRIVLVPHPAARAVATAWPLEAWWRANQPDRDGTPAADAAAGGAVLVARAEGLPQPHPLDGVEWTIFERCSRGDSLDAIADALGDEARALPAAIARLARLGAFSGFRLAA